MRNKNAKVSNPNDFNTNPGDIYHVIFSPEVQPDGSIVLSPCGKDDIQQMIDSYRDQCDMSMIVKRLAMGDTSVLTDKSPMFGDFTQVPKTYAEVLQLVINAEKEFMNLPLDVRNEFDNDYRKWFASAGSVEWFSKMKPIMPNAEKVSHVESEVVKDES